MTYATQRPQGGEGGASGTRSRLIDCVWQQVLATQHRLQRRYRHFIGHGKRPPIPVKAVARARSTPEGNCLLMTGSGSFCASYRSPLGHVGASSYGCCGTAALAPNPTPWTHNNAGSSRPASQRTAHTPKEGLRATRETAGPLRAEDEATADLGSVIAFSGGQAFFDWQGPLDPPLFALLAHESDTIQAAAGGAAGQHNHATWPARHGTRLSDPAHLPTCPFTTVYRNHTRILGCSTLLRRHA